MAIKLDNAERMVKVTCFTVYWHRSSSTPDWPMVSTTDIPPPPPYFLFLCSNQLSRNTTAFRYGCSPPTPYSFEAWGVMSWVPTMATASHAILKPPCRVWCKTELRPPPPPQPPPYPFYLRPLHLSDLLSLILFCPPPPPPPLSLTLSFPSITPPPTPYPFNLPLLPLCLFPLPSHIIVSHTHTHTNSLSVSY